MQTNEEIQSKLSKFISTWTQKYKFMIKPIANPSNKENTQNINEFVVEFSFISQEKPIPDTSLKVFFYLPANSSEMTQLAFQFEHDELLHKLNSTIKYEDMEAFIEMHLNYKQESKMNYFLCTSFEKTRIMDPRIALLAEKTQPKELKVDQFKILDPIMFATRKINPDIYKTEKNQNNTVILQELNKIVVKTFRFLDFEYCSAKDLKLFFQLFAISPNDDSEWNYLFGENDKPTEGFIASDKILHLLKETAFSKVIFEVIFLKIKEKLAKMRISATELIKKRFSIIFEEIRSILRNLILNNNMSISPIKQLLKGLNEKFLSLTEIDEIEKHINPEHITPDLIRGIEKNIYDTKIKNFVQKFLMSLEPAIYEHLILYIRGKELSFLTKESFFDVLKNNGKVVLTERQIFCLWRMLMSKGLVLDGQLSIDEHFIIVTTYVQVLVDFKEFFEKFNNLEIDEKENQIVFTDQLLQDQVFKILKIDSEVNLQEFLHQNLKFFTISENILENMLKEMDLLKNQKDGNVEEIQCIKILILDSSFKKTIENFIIN